MDVECLLIEFVFSFQLLPACFVLAAFRADPLVPKTLTVFFLYITILRSKPRRGPRCAFSFPSFFLETDPFFSCTRPQVQQWKLCLGARALRNEILYESSVFPVHNQYRSHALTDVQDIDTRAPTRLTIKRGK